MGDREQGACESTTRAFIKSMGQLTPAQQVDAAQALTLAVGLDCERDGSKAAALSRELRQLVTRLSLVAGGRGQNDRVAALQDEVARKRAERAKRGQAG